MGYVKYFMPETGLEGNKVKYSKEELNDFEKTVKPVVEWLQKRGCPHDRIIVEYDSAEFVSGEMAFPVEVPD